MRTQAGHEWVAVMVTGQGWTRAGRECTRCGVVRYVRFDEIMWRYPDGRLHGSRTVDEPTCSGKVEG